MSPSPSSAPAWSCSVPDGLRLALTTLTVARVRGPDTLDRRTAGRAMELAPLVGLLLGLIAATVLYGGRQLQEARATALLPCVLAVGTLALLTRGLHLDGLADLSDGLASYKDPAGARAVMRAPDVGPLGVASLFLVLLVQVAALLACVAEGRGTASLLLSVAAGRLAITAACRSTPAALPDGLGAFVAGTVRRGATSAWFVLLAVGFTSYAVIDPDTTGTSSTRILRTLLALVLALLAARLLRAHAVRRVGGLTGDVLGALSEVATAVCLVVLSAGPSGF
jgi:adenosylcobinamide-GDP ribazoletransferase